MFEFYSIDLPALMIIVLASILCALLGSFLILKKQAVMVDAISHSVLPGIVCGVILSGSFSVVYVMGGALVASLIAVSLVYVFQHYLKIEQGAAIGSVFTFMFAVGVMLLETQVGSTVHLDTQHVLYGALELTHWPSPHSWGTLPMQIKTLFLLLIVTILFMALFFKELRLITFDSKQAALLGYKVSLFNIALMILTALTAVACFEATGSILVIALFICPAAAARLHCNQLSDQLSVSIIIAIVTAVLGYALSAMVPLYLGFENTINSAAAIAFFSGIALIISIMLSLKKKDV